MVDVPLVGGDEPCDAWAVEFVFAPDVALATIEAAARVAERLKNSLLESDLV